MAIRSRIAAHLGIRRDRQGTALLVPVASASTALAVALAGPTFGIALVAGVAAALLAVAFPGVVFALYLLSGTYKAAVQPFSPIDITAALAVLNGLQAVPVILGHSSRSVSRAGVVMLVAIACLYLAGAIYAPNQDVAVRFLANHWGLALLPVVPAAARVGSAPRHIRHFLWVLFGLGLVMVVVGAAQLTSATRLVAFGASTIEVSRAALLVPIIGIAWVLKLGWRPARVVTVLLAPVAVLVALGTGSRGPLFAALILGVVAAVRAVAGPRSMSWRVAGAIAAVVVGTALVVVLFATDLPGLSVERIVAVQAFLASAAGGSADTSVLDASAGRRLFLFGVATSMFIERPLLGYGTGGFATQMPFDVWPHNAILQYAAEFGIVGLVAFATLVALAAFRRFPPGHPGQTVRLVLMFYLLNSMVSDDIYGNRTAWGLFALVFLIDVARQTATSVAGATSPATRPVLTPAGRRRESVAFGGGP